ncbi:hypothetical protein [Leadbetterella byssophila]|uniref:Lipoprotein n=1 Tax=Leadbetterella byssophila (strain DSM 17132 / JCM 16389 / KACC 11308 / NBRC 106382 / 4M15) TaxID=649349 RepID=E4RQ97_LEAB4|nr:hypothetical protein [Leadbetterella byssophila]ADQ17472.1 hypothetical protein Lbys_1765 [Leadbetterella byssophila DSM 17132]
MKKLLLLSLIPLLSSCFTSKVRKSEEYYFINEGSIKDLLKNYDKMYQKQPFALGFSDRRFSYYTLIMYTDTVRYIYNSKLKRELVFEEMMKSPLQNEELTQLAQQIKELECLWIDKSELYLEGRKIPATFLSFKSLLFHRPFEENKYYILAFLDSPLPKTTTTRRLRKYGYHEVGHNVYFTISNRFR